MRHSAPTRNSLASEHRKNPTTTSLFATTNHPGQFPTATMSRPTVTVVSAKGEVTQDTIPVPNVFKVSSTVALRDPRYDATGNPTNRLREKLQ